jgi:hypothetical protein
VTKREFGDFVSSPLGNFLSRAKKVSRGCVGQLKTPKEKRTKINLKQLCFLSNLKFRSFLTNSISYKKTKNPMAQATQRGLPPSSYVKKDGTIFQFCGGGAPVVGLAAATTRTGGQLKRTKDNAPEACALPVTNAVLRTCNAALSSDSAACALVRPAHYRRPVRFRVPAT